MAQSIELLTEKMQDIKTGDDTFLGNDLSYEKTFLNQIAENCSKEIKDCEVSFYFSRKKIISIYCKISVMTETIANKLLDIVGLLIEQHFFLSRWFKTTRLV